MLKQKEMILVTIFKIDYVHVITQLCAQLIQL